MSALPPKPKMTPVVCAGLIRPKLDHAMSKLRLGQASCAAAHTPMNIPNTAQTSVSPMPTLIGSS